MKNLIYIGLIVFIFAFLACSKQEQEEKFETIPTSQIPTSEDIKFKETSQVLEEPALTKEQEEILANYQEEREERARRSAADDEEFFKRQEEMQNRSKMEYERNQGQ